MRLTSLFCTLICLAVYLIGAIGPTACHAAEEGPWTISVAAGGVDRSNLPLRARITVPEGSPAAEGGAAVRIRLADGSHVDGQVVPTELFAPLPRGPYGFDHRDIVFMLPKLEAGSTVKLQAELLPADPKAEPRLRWAEELGAAALLRAEKPIVRYEMPAYDPSSEEKRLVTYKPFHHVFDPVTGIRLTKGEGGQFTHHRGIFFGYNEIGHGEGRKTSSDCWHCVKGARQEHRLMLDEVAGAVAGVQRVAIDWMGSDDSKVLGEVRELEVVPVPGGTIIDFASRLTADAPVRLDGDPQHSGVHFRASNEVHESTKGQTYYLRPGVKAEPGAFRNWPDDKTYVNAPWHAVSFVVGGQRYTVLRVNRPANPGEARMSERDYARFGSYFEYDLEPSRPLQVGYRFWVQPGELSLDEAARIAADYQKPAEVRVTGG
ncbi:MAG: DUF6807 family protein [Planctomycetaceae bacterium]